MVQYGKYENHPVVFNETTAWEFDNGTWREIDHTEVFANAHVMTSAEFASTFGGLPPVPNKAAKA